MSTLANRTDNFCSPLSGHQELDQANIRRYYQTTPTCAPPDHLLAVIQSTAAVNYDSYRLIRSVVTDGNLSPTG